MKPKHMFLILEVSVSLLYARILLSFFSFKTISKKFYSKNMSNEVSSQEDTNFIVLLKEIIVKVSNKIPFDFSCYPQSLAGKMILNRRNLRSTLFLGVRKNKSGEFEGHAWLVCSNIKVTRRRGYQDNQIINSYT